jgi:aryl-alcohol dehydrogenase-like predicted oxidoreductase
MRYNKLGNSDIQVSEICLGSMTWGVQNSEAEGHAQIDLALERGVNFIDTAELYPSPISGDTQGATETIIGNWFKQSGKRDQVILASKVAGNGIKWIQDGIDISPQKIRNSIEGSLTRLQTDYIDLYQLHWPNRGSYHFRQNWKYDPTGQSRDETLAHIRETLACLAELITEGKIRTVGLSNETCWGTSQFLCLAEEHGLPRVVSIQNEYSLMYRLYDLDLAELSHNEQVSLLPYSPLAAGMLTGKYRDGNIPAGSRRSLTPDLYGRVTEDSLKVANAYADLALKHGLEPAHMAIAFCNQQPFVASSIIGATSIEQLELDLGAADLVLGPAVLDEIKALYRQYPIPF